MASKNLNNLLTGQTLGGTWGTSSPCGDTSNNPDVVDLSDPTSVDFTGKELGTYTFYYSVSATGCPNDCTLVTVVAVDCCDVTINNITSTQDCPNTLTINYMVTSHGYTNTVVAIKNELGNLQYNKVLDTNMSAVGMHTLTISNFPCTDFNSETWTVELCCLNLS